MLRVVHELRVPGRFAEFKGQDQEEFREVHIVVRNDGRMKYDFWKYARIETPEGEPVPLDTYKWERVHRAMKERVIDAVTSIVDCVPAKENMRAVEFRGGRIDFR